jgi:hypothetical protein
MQTKLTTNHELIPLDQIDSDTVFAVDASHLFTKYSQPCNLHNLIADKFCEECLELCCSDCTYIPKHTNHKMKINLLKELQPAMINQFKEKFIPQTKIRLNKLREIESQIEEKVKQVQVDHINDLNSLDADRIDQREQIEIQFNERKEYLELAFSNTTNGLKENQSKVKTSIKIAEETIESVEQSLISENVYDLPLKKAQFIKASEEIAEPSLDEIYHVPAEVGPAYPVTRKKRKLEDVQYFPEYERVMESNGLDLQFGVRPDNEGLIRTEEGVEVVSDSSKGILSWLNRNPLVDIDIRKNIQWLSVKLTNLKNLTFL